MDQQPQQESISRYSYLFVAIISVIQTIVIWLSTDSSIQIESEYSHKLIYLPLLLAVFVPSVISYLITHARSATFYINILITIIFTTWIAIWQARHDELSTHSSLFIPFSTLTILFFFLLPWMQMRQSVGTWKINYSCLISFYIKNTFLAIFASTIAGLVVTINYLASFLFQVVNLDTLSDILSSKLAVWALLALSFNISLVFLRSTFDLQLGKFVSYIARFFLITLNVIAIIFMVGFLISQITGLTLVGLGSSGMLWFLILNIVLINLVYGDGSTQYQFFSWLNPFVLFSILLLNFFSLLAVYGILIRVEQYSWSINRLYAFTVALFIAAIVLAYSIAVIRKKTGWMLSLGSINKVGLLGLIAIILLINSPIADFKRITLNSLLIGIENGRIKINSMLAYDLTDLGPNGQKALEKLKSNPEYKKAFEVNTYDTDQPEKSLKEVLVLAKNSIPLPESWWTKRNKDSVWYCTARYDPYHCLGFVADVNQDGQNDVVMCYSPTEGSNFECLIWQETESEWAVADRQASQYNSTEERDDAWKKLLDGQFNLTPKEWRQITPQ